jgi:four helix bundle protein
MTNFELRTTNFELRWPAASFLLSHAKHMPYEYESFQARAFRFACDIVKLYRRLNKSTDVPLVLARQLLRSGTSVGANLEEAKAAQSKRDATARFSIALKESRETHYWLRLLAATDSVPRELLTRPLRDANELISVLTVARRKMRASCEKESKSELRG